MAEKKDSKERLILPPCCCLLFNIEYTVLGEDFVVQLFLEPQFNENGDCFYELDLPLPVAEDPFILSWGTILKEEEGWAISADGFQLYVFESDYICPVSTLEDWEYIGPSPAQVDVTSLFISAIDCEEPEIDVPDVIVPDPNCNEPFSCKFVNLLKKQRASLAKDVAGNSNYEVFGLKGCEENWNNLFMRSLIIDALQCVPQNVYSEATENCLINKLTENCNC